MEWNWWVLIGTAFQVLGLVIAGLGVARTRERYAPERPGILGAIARAGDRVHAWVSQRVLRRPPRAQQIGSVSIDARSEVGAPDVFLRPAPLDPAITVEEQIRILDRWMREAHASMVRIAGTLNEHDSHIKVLQAQVNQATVQAREHTETSIKELAAGGISMEAWGLFVTALGIVLAAIGSGPGAWLAPS